jgi:hypothetical protein
MNWRQDELLEFGSEVTWLDDTAALEAFQRADACCSKIRYGLNEATFACIERLDVDEPGAEARRWLAERTGRGNEQLLLVFGKTEVCVVRAAFFQQHWQDLFRPSRDDVVILPLAGSWVLFYCHEDEFEFAPR